MKECTEALRNGGIAVIPTDTIYGVVARAEDKAAVERVYEVKGRTPEKPCIILISKEADINIFCTGITEKQKRALHKYWPGPVSIIFSIGDQLARWKELEYLHRGTGTLSFRFPRYKKLTELIEQTGPLIAPSANPEGHIPAKNIAEAKSYFGDSVDCYMDGGELAGSSSALIRVKDNGEIEVLRGKI